MLTVCQNPVPCALGMSSHLSLTCLYIRISPILDVGKQRVGIKQLD